MNTNTYVILMLYHNTQMIYSYLTPWQPQLKKCVNILVWDTQDTAYFFSKVCNRLNIEGWNLKRKLMYPGWNPRIQCRKLIEIWSPFAVALLSVHQYVCPSVCKLSSFLSPSSEPLSQFQPNRAPCILG